MECVFGYCWTGFVWVGWIQTTELCLAWRTIKLVKNKFPMVNDPNKPFQLELPAVSWQLTLLHRRRNASGLFQQGGNINNALMLKNKQFLSNPSGYTLWKLGLDAGTDFIKQCLVSVRMRGAQRSPDFFPNWNSFSQLLDCIFPRSFSATSLQTSLEEQVHYTGTLVCMFMLYVVGVFADLCCSVHVLPLI